MQECEFIDNHNFLKSKLFKYSLTEGLGILSIKIDGSDKMITKLAKDPRPTVSINEIKKAPNKIIVSFIL